MKLFKVSLCVFAFFACNLLLATNDPAIQIKETSENVLEILYSDSQNIEKDILTYLDSNYDLDILLRRTLGRNWNKIYPEHRSKVIALIKRLVIRAYIDGMRGQKKPEIEYSETLYLSRTRAEVPAFVYFSENGIAFTYRMGLISEKWEIFDIIVENISIVLNFRNQFDVFFARHSSLELIEKLESLLFHENLGETLSNF